MTEEPSLTIEEFCRLEGFSKTTYHRIKLEGNAPRELRTGNIVRISPQARRDWHALMENRSPAAEEEARAARRAARKQRARRPARKQRAAR